MTIVFTPTATGSETGELTIASNDNSRASLVIELAGTGGVRGSTIEPVRINLMSPDAARVGERVIFLGTGFSADLADVTVRFGGVAAPLFSVSSSLIEAAVPLGVPSGEVDLVISIRGQASFPIKFRVRSETAVPPVIDAVSTDEGRLVISWPAELTNMFLQSTTSLVPPVTWAAATDVPVVITGRNTITIQPTATPRFFRLVRF